MLEKEMDCVYMKVTDKAAGGEVSFLSSGKGKQGEVPEAGI